MTLWDVLEEVPDPRQKKGRRHPLAAILRLAILAVIAAGESSMLGISQWGRAQSDKIRESLGFTHQKLPCVATIFNLFKKLPWDQLEAQIADWIANVIGSQVESMSIDGKVLRGSKREGKKGLLLVSAAAHQLGMVIGQKATTEDRGEVEAAIRLLKEIQLADKTVTLDAGLTQTQICQQIVEADGDYIGIIKDNHQEIKEAIEFELQEKLKMLPDAKEESIRGSFIEKREIWVSDQINDYLTNEYRWPDVQQVGIIHRVREKKYTQKKEEEYVCLITNSPADQKLPQQILHSVRGHWQIENRIHWVRDVTFNEDRQTARITGKVLATIRNIAIGLIRHAGWRFIPQAKRHYSANIGQAIQLIKT